jgi:hypothetical protein
MAEFFRWRAAGLAQEVSLLRGPHVLVGPPGAI